MNTNDSCTKITACLDMLAVALASHGHKWSDRSAKPTKRLSSWPLLLPVVGRLVRRLQTNAELRRLGIDGVLRSPKLQANNTCRRVLFGKALEFGDILCAPGRAGVSIRYGHLTSVVSSSRRFWRTRSLGPFAQGREPCEVITLLRLFRCR